MIFRINITLFHKYMQINYYHDKHHDNCTVMTQYVKIALLSLSFMTSTLSSPWARSGDNSHDDVRQQRSQHIHHAAQYTVHHVIPAYLVEVAVWQVVQWFRVGPETRGDGEVVIYFPRLHHIVMCRPVRPGLGSEDRERLGSSCSVFETPFFASVLSCCVGLRNRVLDISGIYRRPLPHSVLEVRGNFAVEACVQAGSIDEVVLFPVCVPCRHQGQRLQQQAAPGKYVTPSLVHHVNQAFQHQPRARLE